MADSETIFFHPHNNVHETIIGCSFIGALIGLCIFAELYRRHYVQRIVLGPTDFDRSSEEHGKNPRLYAPQGIRWWHRNAPAPSGDQSITQACEDAAALNSIPQWVFGPRSGANTSRPVSQQHPMALTVDTAQPAPGADEIGSAFTSTAFTSATTSSPAKSVAFEEGAALTKKRTSSQTPQSGKWFMRYSKDPRNFGARQR